MTIGRPIRYLDVCSGYSAFTLGAAGLGFECAGYSEIEPFPRAILGQRHGAVAVDWDHRHTLDSNVRPLFGDFTQIEAHHVGPVDLLNGGTPCQSFSVAGKRLGLDDPRGNLTLEFLALARRIRADWLLWENVPGFLSHDEGRTMGTLLRLLGECGYGWAYRVLDAQFIRVDGHEGAVPQRRRRLFVVAHLGDAAGPAAVLFERESLRGDPAPRREQGEGVAPTISARTKGGGGLGTDFDCDGGLIPHPLAGDVSPTINAAFGSKLGLDNQHIDSGAGLFVAQSIHSFDARQSDVIQYGDISGPMDTKFPAPSIAFAQNSRDEVRLFGGDGQTVGALGAEPGMKQQSYVAHAIQAGALRENPASGPDGVGVQADVAYTLEARAEVQAVQHAWAVRRLTPTECERLMGVPDGFTAITYRGKPAADGPRYKALGNSQAVNNMRWLALGLRDVIDAQDAVT